VGNRRAQLVCVWTGPLCAVLFIIGAVLLGHFIPPMVAPSDTAQVVARKFAEHTTQIRLGALVTIISMSLVATWGVTVAAQLRRTEGAFPVLTYVQLMCVAVGTVVVVLMSMFWAVAAFRPDTYSAETVQVLNDTAYFLLLFTWPPFAVWSACVALAILTDPNKDRPVFPRWVGYLSIWVTLLFMPAGMMAFFKVGVFSWNGLVALYIPVIIFFVWLLVLTRYTIVNINDGYYHGGVSDDARRDAALVA
jgi:hypothetical protein